MATNIEIKARIHDFKKMLDVARELSDLPEEIIIQEDTFFHIKNGRLKLRIFSNDSGELIHYARQDTQKSKRSDYLIYPTSTPSKLKEVLSNALGIKVVVKKERRLFVKAQTRIHLDKVEGLGNFIEFEVVINKEKEIPEAYQTIEELEEIFGIKENQLITVAYADLILDKYSQSK